MVNASYVFCAPDLQLISINTDNVKDERGDENIHRSRGSAQFCENLLCREIARQHTWSSKLYFGNSKDPPIAIWLILTILILPILFCKICLLFGQCWRLKIQLICATCYGGSHSWGNAWCVWAQLKHPLRKRWMPFSWYFSKKNTITKNGHLKVEVVLPIKCIIFISPPPYKKSILLEEKSIRCVKIQLTYFSISSLFPLSSSAR